MLPCPAGADNVREEPAAELWLENPKGAAMPGSHAAEIVVDFLQSSEDWPETVLTEDEAEPELDLPPLPPPRPSVR
jgi:hypothetical protein